MTSITTLRSQLTQKNLKVTSSPKDNQSSFQNWIFDSNSLAIISTKIAFFSLQRRHLISLFRFFAVKSPSDHSSRSFSDRSQGKQSEFAYFFVSAISRSVCDFYGFGGSFRLRHRPKHPRVYAIHVQIITLNALIALYL